MTCRRGMGRGDRWFLAVAGLFGLLVAPGAVSAAVEMTVYAVDALTRVRPDGPPRAAQPVALFAAQNEYESFQVVIRAGSQPLKGVTVRVTDLAGKDGATIRSSNIALFREHYIEVAKPSPKSAEGAGWYPDALIPFVNPADSKPLRGGRFAAAPFDVASNASQSVWVDVRVPKGQPAGEYVGRAVVTGAEGAAEELPVRVTVWGFALPDVPSLRSHFGSFGSRVARGHRMDVQSQEFRGVEERYAEEMARHRLSPPIPFWFKPTITADGTIDPATTHAYGAWIERFHVTVIPLWLFGKDPLGKDREHNANYLRSTYAYLKRHGWENRAYVYVLDEPAGTVAFEDLRRRAAFIREVQPGLKILCTTEPQPRNPAWGSVIGSVDIWVSLWPHFNEAAITERQRADDEVWSYTALTQGAAGRDTPFWQIDFPLLNYRVPMWMSWRYGLSGLLYSTTVYWDKTADVWTNPLTDGSYNGEGSLFYPGSEVGFNGPVASMRLKAIRDGMEDYEYLKILAAQEGGEAARQFVGRLTTGWTRWEKDPGRLHEVRRELGERINARIGH